MTYEEDVRHYVVKHPNTPASVLETFSKDEDWSVRACIAENPNTPKYTIIEMLLIEENPYVSEQLRERLNKEEE